VTAGLKGRGTSLTMQAMSTDDDCFGPGKIRTDGRVLHPCCLFQVKAPGASKGPWDYHELLHTTPADQAFRPLGEGGCALVRT
jgi:branched-chain amino acid transport system substrate-binding protein